MVARDALEGTSSLEGKRGCYQMTASVDGTWDYGVKMHERRGDRYGKLA